MMISAQEMESLLDFFTGVPDPRRVQGRRQKISTILAIAAGATLCGMRGYLAIADWAQSLKENFQPLLKSLLIIDEYIYIIYSFSSPGWSDM
ncbi:MAG: transposase family protein [Syntrophobacterales bacterium]|nr:transposase family protein [Syntrophobacterales bacterium]